MSKDKLIATAPETIWLCVSDDPDQYRLPFPKDTGEVTWAGGDCPVCCGVKYVRSDVQSAELTALRKVAEAAEKFCRAEGRDDPPAKYATLKQALEAAGYKPTRMH